VKYCFSSFFHILFNLKKTLKIKRGLCSGVHSYGIGCHGMGQMVPYMLRKQSGIIRPLKMIPLCCLETMGTNHPVTWCHISEDWRPWLQHCNSLKPHTGLLLCFHHLEKVKNSNNNIYLTNMRDKSLLQSIVLQNTKENKKVYYFSSSNQSICCMVWKDYFTDVYSKYDPAGINLQILKRILIQEWLGWEIIHNSKSADHYDKPNSVNYNQPLH
jgi:hypothetical protein